MAPMRREANELALQQQRMGLEQAQQQMAQSNRINDLVEVASIPSAQRGQYLMTKRAEMAQMGEDTRGIDALLAMPEGDRDSRIQSGLQMAQMQGLIQAPAQQSPTTKQRDYSFYAQQEASAGRQPLSFNDWDKQARAAGATQFNMGPTGIDYGDPEKGFAWARDETGKVVTEPDPQGRLRPVQVPIAGGSVERDLEETARKLRGRKTEVSRAAGTVVQDLGRGLERLPEVVQTEGVIGANARAALSNVKGTAEYQIQQFIDSAKSNIGLDRLQVMRETSPTGGALGQVPFQQQQRLEQVLGEMKLDMEIQDLEDNMKRIMNIYRDIMFGSADERQALVESGKLTPEENAKIQSEYFELSFDEMGRTRELSPAEKEEADIMSKYGL